MEKVISKSEKETELFAKEFSKRVKTNDVIVFYGEVGAGKTAFIKALLKSLNVKEEVVSPTYALLNVYDDYYYHFDFYRVSSGGEAESLGLTDYFKAGNVCLIEWPDNIEDVLPERLTKITIKKLAETEREITVENL